MTTTTSEYLETYLQDHRAGAAMGSDLTRRIAEENQGTTYEGFLVTLTQEIDDDLAAFEQIMERFGVTTPTLKIAAAKVGEKLGRLKPNERLTAYSPLSRVLEFEALRAWVEGQLALWDALAQLAPTDERLDAEQIAGLQARAQKQLDGLREQHLMASREAFVGG